MAYFEDLTSYTYSSNDSAFECNANELNVGWLSKGRPFPIGTVPEPVIVRLKKLGKSAVRLTCGLHYCEYCGGDWQTRPHGTGEVRVIARTGLIYTAPTLIVHYITEHHYLPPAPFLEAVLDFNIILPASDDDPLIAHILSARGGKIKTLNMGASGTYIEMGPHSLLVRGGWQYRDKAGKVVDKQQDWEKRTHLNVSRIIDRTINEIVLVRNPLSNLIIGVDDGSILEVFGDEDGEDWDFDGICCTVRKSGDAIDTTKL